MVIKTYGVDGKTAVRWPLKNPTGDVTFIATFRNGCLDEKQKRPATCIVSNPVDQLIIENHRLFKMGIIRLISTSGQAETMKTAQVNAEVKKAAGRKKVAERTVVKASGLTTYPDVKTVGDATNVLLSLGVSMADLRDEDAILKAAADLKLHFPNYEG